jgi:5,10-methylenetetrahydromethanopterin reductase
MSKHEISIAFQTDKRAAEYVELAQLVDGYDFDCVTVYCDAPFHPSYGPLMLMAPHISRARLGAAAISPSRMHPIDIAAQTALLADIAKSSVYVGLARGAWLSDHGISELDPPIQAIREAAKVVRYMLRGEIGGYRGDVYQIADHIKSPYPLPDYEPPLLIGTWGRSLCGVAGEIADEVKIGGSANPNVIPHIRSYIAAGEKRVGRSGNDVQIVIGAVTVVDEDRDVARAAARRSVALYLPVVAGLDPSLEVEPELISRIETLYNVGDIVGACSLISDDLLDRFAFSGAPADLIRQAGALFGAGAGRVEFGTPHGLNKPEAGIRLIGDHVIPALRQNWS